MRRMWFSFPAVLRSVPFLKSYLEACQMTEAISFFPKKRRRNYFAMSHKARKMDKAIYGRNQNTYE